MTSAESASLLYLLLPNCSVLTNFAAKSEGASGHGPQRSDRSEKKMKNEKQNMKKPLFSNCLNRNLCTIF